MPMRTTPIHSLAVAIALGALGAWAGDLNPPGAPAPTANPAEPRTPIFELPFVISTPGSYYLTGNLTGIAASPGISVEADNVTIDLNGFALIGVAGSLAGIHVPNPQSALAVRNGIIRDWDEDGLQGRNASGCLIESVQALGNGTVIAHGGLLVGDTSVVRACIATQNGVGMGADADSVVQACIAENNASGGIAADEGSTISASTARGNGGIGIYSGGSVTGCSAVHSGSDGIACGTVIGCTASDNGRDGISISSSGLATDCVAYSNDRDGIVGIDGSTIRSCTSTFNTGDGIEVRNDCRVEGNTCDSNAVGGDGAGVHVTGADTRVDGNTVTDNPRGIDVDAAGNLVVRNSASGNTTDYDIAAGNDVGLLRDTPVASGAWDNFEF
jgi:parallel beta-helix repeat protein